MQQKIIIRRGSMRSMVTGMIMGSVIGGTIALLVAPQSGMQTRRMIADQSNQMMNKAGDTVSNVRDRMMEMADDTRGKISDMAGNARDKANQVVSNVRNRQSMSGPSDADRVAGEVDELNRDVNILEDDIDKTYNL